MFISVKAIAVAFDNGCSSRSLSYFCCNFPCPPAPLADSQHNELQRHTRAPEVVARNPFAFIKLQSTVSQAAAATTNAPAQPPAQCLMPRFVGWRNFTIDCFSMEYVEGGARRYGELGVTRATVKRSTCFTHYLLSCDAALRTACQCVFMCVCVGVCARGRGRLGRGQMN